MQTRDDGDPMIPAIGTVPQPERMFRINWVAGLSRSPAGVPMHAPEFVARQGRRVRLIDIREPDELTGALGHIPGVDWVPPDRVASLFERLHRDAPLLLISRGGERASTAALALEKRGMRFVAAMQGGMLAWKALGFATVRNPRILARPDVVREIVAESTESTGPLTQAQLEKHIGDPLAVRWIKMAALLVHGRQSCVDGRDDSGVIGTPGGDGGEFLLALGSLEKLTGKAIDAHTLAILLRRRLDTFGRFYMHTDIHAANENIKSMRSDRRLDEPLSKVREALEWRRFMREPPVAIRDILLEHITQPGHIGCGHVRLMMLHPEAYGVRKELTPAFVRVFLQTIWSGAVEAEYTPLAGGHREGGVVNVRIEGALWPFTSIPLISPSAGGTQFFVNHPQVSDFQRQQLAQFLCLQSDILPVTAKLAEPLVAEIASLASKQMDVTLRHLAHGLPVYDATFDSTGHCTVTEVGSVPD